jgi:hypothetical protein
MERLASSCLARHARLRHDGRHPASRQRHAAPKNEPPKDDVKDRKAPSPLIRWSVQEIRRIAIRLAQRRINPAHVIAWSIWRRAHQAIARKAHIKQNRQL